MRYCLLKNGDPKKLQKEHLNTPQYAKDETFKDRFVENTTVEIFK